MICLVTVNMYSEIKEVYVLQLLDVLDDWTKFYGNNKQIDIVYLDIIKAFDIVQHGRLLL